MKDQVDGLRVDGVAAAFLNSTQSPDERDAVVVDLHNKPGAMGGIARDLAEAGVNVDVAYTIFSGVRLVIVTDDTEKARAALG